MEKFIVGQLGIPRHSAVAKMLYKEHLLDKFITDTYFSTKSMWAKLPALGPKLVNNLKRYDAGFPEDIVLSDWYGALKFRQLLKKTKRTEAFKFATNRLGERLIKYAEGKEPGKYFGFDTTSLGFLEWSHNKGWKAYLEQCVAPRKSQIEMWELFQDKYGIDYSSQIAYCQFQQGVERKEWEYANHIIVPSQYVKNELIKDGNLDINKVNVINYGYTPDTNRNEIAQHIEQKFALNSKGTTNILFAGNAGYRKGLGDMVELASDLRNEDINFVIAGLLETEAQDLISKYPYKNIQYVGKLSKDELAAQYKKADLFFFPSYLEGSALVLIEAMSWGLPIVTTYQSGSVIKNGVEGLISQAGDIEDMKSNIMRLIADDELRYSMSIAAFNDSVNYSVERYGQELLELFKK